MALRNRTVLPKISNQENVKNVKPVVTAVAGPTRRAALGEIGNKVTTLRGGVATNKSQLLKKVEKKPEHQHLQPIITKSQVTSKPVDKNTSPVAKLVEKREPIEETIEPSRVDKVKEKTEAFSSDLLAVDDVDEADRKNPMLVTIYSNDIYKYLMQLEAQYPIQKDYLAGQEITAKMRSVLIDWLVEVHQQFHLLQETLYLTVAIIDRFLQSYRKITKRKLQLVGVAAMFIACKYEEMYSPDITDFVYITDNAYSKNEILYMEMLIARTLDFSFGRPLPLHFLRRYSKGGRALPLHHVKAKYFLELCLIHHKVSHYPPSLLAAAALYLAFFLVGNEGQAEGELIWTNTLVHYSTYTKDDIMPVVREIARIVIDVDKNKFQAVCKKYSQAKHMKVSLRPELRSPSLQYIASCE